MQKSFGLSLSSVSSVPDRIRAKLRELSIDTAEEFVALAAVEGTGALLSEYLGISATQLSEYVGKAKGKMPKRVASAMEEPYNQALAMGALEPPPELMASGPGPYESMICAAALPPNVNHISRFRPVQHQGQRGTCVSFACTALNEDYYRYATGGPPDLSEQCLYKRCKENDGSPNSNGTWVRVGMDCLVKFGQSTEICEPYNPNPPTNQPGPHSNCCTSECGQYKVPKSLQLNPKSVTDIKGALADGKPVAFSIPVYHSWYDSAAVRQTGNITMPIPGENACGGHAMLFVGYQDDSAVPGGGYFILRNSWGTSWGYNDTTYGAGYGTLPFQYMTNDGWEAYTTDLPIHPVCAPRPLIHCPVKPLAPCQVRPIVQKCPPRPILLCPPRPYTFCPPRPLITCPPAAKSPTCHPGPFGPIPPGPGPYQGGYYPGGGYYSPWSYPYPPQSYSPECYWGSSEYPEGYYPAETYYQFCPCCGAPLQQDPSFDPGQFNPQVTET